MLRLFLIILGLAVATFVAARAQKLLMGRIVLWVSVVPPICLTIYSGVLFTLAIITDSKRYAFADMGFGISLMLTAVWSLTICGAFFFGRTSRRLLGRK